MNDIELYDNSPDFWERLPDETNKAYAAFCCYRDMGSERGIRKVAQVIGKSYTYLEEWSKKYDWVNRVTAYDDYLDSKNRAVREKSLIDVKQAWADIAHDMREFGKKALALRSPSDLSARDLKDWMLAVQKIEALSHDAPTDISQSNITTNIDAMEQKLNNDTKFRDFTREFFIRFADGNGTNGTNDMELDS